MQHSVKIPKKMKLDFLHKIPLEVNASGVDTHLVIQINAQTVFEKTYAPGPHTDIVEFSFAYDNSVKNKMEFVWTGAKEVANKHLRIRNIEINKQVLNLYNAEYFPNINNDWWQSLSNEEIDHYEEVIYGKTGNTFGWYGSINLYYCTGVDLRARYEYNNLDNDTRKLLHEGKNWIFANKDDAKIHHKSIS